MMRSKGHLGNLMWLMAKTDFKLRYQGSVLGFVWALLKPLFIFGILYVVFSNVFGGVEEHYALKLLLGIVFWTFFAEGTMLGLHAFESKGHLISKVAFPRWIVVFSTWLQSAMTFAVMLLIFLVVVMLSGVSFGVIQFFGLMIYVTALLVLVLALSFLFAPLYLRYRDLNQIWDVMLLGGFYAAPIIYPLEVIPDSLRIWLYLNPMTFLVEHARSVVFSASFSRWDHHLLYGVILLLGSVFAWGVYRKLEGRVVEYL